MTGVQTSALPIYALTQRRNGGIISELDMQGVISARVASLGRHGRTRSISTAVPFSELQPIISHEERKSVV